VLRKHANGSIVADGSEQTLTEVQALTKFSGYLDLSQMEVGDQVTVRQYVMMREGGPYKRYADATYSGVQESPILHISVKVLCYGCKITLQQISGVFKSFDFNFVREEEP